SRTCWNSWRRCTGVMNASPASAHSCRRAMTSEDSCVSYCSASSSNCRMSVRTRRWSSVGASPKRTKLLTKFTADTTALCHLRASPCTVSEFRTHPSRGEFR
ncbi:MAG: hypothetical protein ACK55Z_00675, partial [bacterium]